MGAIKNAIHAGLSRFTGSDKTATALPYQVTFTNADPEFPAMRIVAEFEHPDDVYDFRVVHAKYFVPCNVTVTEFGKVTRQYVCTGRGEE